MKKKRKLVGLALWMIFILLVSGLFYLSFQNGEKSKAEGRQLLTIFTGMSAESEDLEQQSEIDNLIYIIRQSGRVLIFFMIGVAGTSAIYVTANCGWLLKTGIAAVILWVIASFTERMKIYIPTRHYSYEEMMLSIAATLAGLLAVMFAAILVRLIKGSPRGRKAVGASAGHGIN